MVCELGLGDKELGQEVVTKWECASTYILNVSESLGSRRHSSSSGLLSLLIARSGLLHCLQVRSDCAVISTKPPHCPQSSEEYFALGDEVGELTVAPSILERAEKSALVHVCVSLEENLSKCVLIIRNALEKRFSAQPSRLLGKSHCCTLLNLFHGAQNPIWRPRFLVLNMYLEKHKQVLYISKIWIDGRPRSLQSNNTTPTLPTPLARLPRFRGSSF